MSFSSCNPSGGTLALPSPTHAHMDVTTAVHSLRRSISRSPSKFLSRTNSQSSNGSQQNSPQSPCRRFGSTPQRPSMSPPQPRTAPPAVTTSHINAHQSVAFTPLRPSVRLSLRSAKSARTSSPSSRPLTRGRSSPRSPLKRALGTSSDTGNPSRPSFSSLTTTRAAGQENSICASATVPATNESGADAPLATSALRKYFDRPARHSVHLDVSDAASHFSYLKTPEANGEPYVATTTGALKRSDATMNLDHQSQGSPVAKRRSLHGIANLGQADDHNIFDGTTVSASAAVSHGFDIHEDLQSEYQLTGGLGSGGESPPLGRDAQASPTPTSSMPKRSTSLRKSTLQQRYGDKGSLGRRTGERQLAQMSPDISTPARHRPRLSTDHFLPPPVPRDSPFTSGTPLPNPSIHQLEVKGHQPHPLSKILTTSSSGNSLTEETAAYAPVAKLAQQSRPHPFSHSLPLASIRPTVRLPNDHTKAVTTPGQQLWNGAFNSTGLISKVNRNPEYEADKKIAPPDTPCKKHANPFATFPPPIGSAIKRKNSNRNSFAGLPSTPLNRPSGRTVDAFVHPARGLSIFQRGSSSHTRRGSVLSTEGEDRPLFGEAGDVPNPLDGDVPPTPTKSMLTPSLSNLSEQSLESPSANRTFTLPLSAVKPSHWRRTTHKATPKTSLDEGSNLDGGSQTPSSGRFGSLDRQSSPTPSLSPRPSSGRSKAQREPNTPLSQSAQQPSIFSVRQLDAFSKTPTSDQASLASSGHENPETPQETFLPLDTSRLSISRVPEAPMDDGNMPPPVTPTAGREFRSSTSIFVTPVNGRMANIDIDASLYSRFDKVEQVGKGEFSTVFRVTKLEHHKSSKIGDVVPQADSTPSPTKGQVFAVKKSKHSYHGPKDREMKFREVRVLQALAHAEHVVQYVDNWEHNSHLYIQTEFCEEGSLDKFLGNVGRGGRLDDFRIFKILQDLCLVGFTAHCSDLLPPPSALSFCLNPRWR